MLVISCFIAEWLALSNLIESSESYPVADNGFASLKGLLVMEFLAFPVAEQDLLSTDFGESGMEFGVPVLDHKRRDLLPLVLKKKDNANCREWDYNRNCRKL